MRHLVIALAVALGCDRCSTRGSSEQRYSVARSIIRDKCLRCHPAFDRDNEADWVASGYVLAGDAPQSPIYRFLKGANVGGPESMPKTNTTLSAQELAQLRVWIEGMPADAAGSDAFKRAKALITSKCVTCHQPETGLPDFTLATETEWVDSGFVVAGNPNGSALYNRLRGAGVGVQDEDMPFELPGLSDEELATITTWIAGIDVTTSTK